MEFNNRNIFVQKSYPKCGGEIIHKPFPKKSKLSVSVDQQPEVLHSLLLLYANLKVVKIQ